ncbi:MAG: pyruvate kinase [Alphaproteobacteria bacterium]
MRRNRAAKILATLGPSSSDPVVIADLFFAGVDIFRLNFSHGTADDHRARAATIRMLEDESDRPIAILADLQGPKLRLGVFTGESATLKAGEPFRLDLDPAPGDNRRVCFPHSEVYGALGPDSELLLDDGRLRLRVVSSGADALDTEVMTGGTVRDRKGVNVPGVLLPLSPMTDKDRKDLKTALKIGVDWVALSFVQRPEDVAEARALIGDKAAIMVKLEKPAAIQQLDEIIALADAVMVARGDLGVELPPEDVPSLQKRIVRACRQAGKPVVIATQMLESMINSPAPTRAEASDVATAVYDGADAVMLSAETAAGAHPVESVTMMSRIIRRVEGDTHYRMVIDSVHARPETNVAGAITAAAGQVAETINAACIITYSLTGKTTMRAARERPQVPILGLTPSAVTARRMSLVWGVHCVRTEDARDADDMVDKAISVARREGFAGDDDWLVITAGVPFGTAGSTNLLRVANVATVRQDDASESLNSLL